MPTAAPTKKRQWAPLRLRRRPQTGASAQAFAAYVFSSGYVLLLLVFGVLPMVYALYLSFTKSGQFVGLDNYVKAVGDFRFLPAVQHVAAFLVIWVVTLTVLVTLLALIVHAMRVRRRLASTALFLFFIPGAFAGAASVMLWLFLLNPSVSPVSFVLKWFGYTNFVQAIDLNNLPLIFTVIAFWTGAGAWIIIMYAALKAAGRFTTTPDRALILGRRLTCRAHVGSASRTRQCRAARRGTLPSSSPTEPGRSGPASCRG